MAVSRWGGRSACGQVLDHSTVGLTECANLLITARDSRGPLDRLVAVATFVPERVPLAIGAEAPRVSCTTTR